MDHVGRSSEVGTTEELIDSNNQQRPPCLVFPYNDVADNCVKVNLGNIVAGDSVASKIYFVNHGLELSEYKIVLLPTAPPWISVESDLGTLAPGVPSFFIVRASPDVPFPKSQFYAAIRTSGSYTLEIESSCSSPPVKLQTSSLDLGTMVEETEYVKVLELTNSSHLPTKVDLSTPTVKDSELSIEPSYVFIEPEGTAKFYFIFKPMPQFLDRHPNLRNAEGALSVFVQFTSSLQSLPIQCTVFGRITSTEWELYPFEVGHCWINEMKTIPVKICNKSEVRLHVKVTSAEIGFESASVTLEPLSNSCLSLCYTPGNTGVVEDSIIFEATFGEPPLKTDRCIMPFKAEVAMCPIQVERYFNLGKIYIGNSISSRINILNKSESTVLLSLSTANNGIVIACLPESLIIQVGESKAMTLFVQIKPGMDTGRQTIACNIEFEPKPNDPPILIELEFDVANNLLTALPGLLDFDEAGVGNSILRDVFVSSSISASLREGSSLSILSPFEQVNAVRDLQPNCPLRLRFAFKPRAIGVYRSNFRLSSSNGSELNIELAGTCVYSRIACVRYSRSWAARSW